LDQPVVKPLMIALPVIVGDKIAHTLAQGIILPKPDRALAGRIP